MDRKGEHEARIEEVKRALAAVQQMQAEIARRGPGSAQVPATRATTELATATENAARRPSGLGAGVLVLLAVAAGAALFVANGPWPWPAWLKLPPSFLDNDMRADGRAGAVAARSGGPPSGAPAAATDEGAGDPTAGLSTQSEPQDEDRADTSATPRQAALPPATQPIAAETPAAAPEREAPAALPLADASPAETAPLETRPAETVPAETVPAETVPAVAAPAQTIPAETVPAERAPATLPPPSPETPARQAAIAAAKRLFEAGRIAAAREALMAAAPEAHADVAWALARTYDPKSIATAGGPMAAADVVEAEKWYRKWYEIGVERGLMSKSFRIDRLIKAMRSP